MNNQNSQTQAKSHAGGNDKLGINFAWPKVCSPTTQHKYVLQPEACYTDVGAMAGAVGAVAPVKITKVGSAPQSSMQDVPQ